MIQRQVPVMLSVKTSRGGASYGEKKLLYPFIQVERTPRMGLVMKDAAAESRATYYASSCREEFPAVYSRRIRDVMLCDSHILYDQDGIYTDNLITAKFARDDAAFEQTAQGHMNIAMEKEQTVPELVHIREPVIVTSNEGSGTWGHWLVHNFPKIALAAKAHTDCKILVPVAYFSGGYANFGALLQMYGFTDDQMIGIYPDKRYKLDDAIIVDFLYTNSVHPYTLQVFDELCQSVDDRLADGKRLLIERTTTGKREVTNRAAFTDRLNRAGFAEAMLGAHPLKKQIAAWRNGREFCSVLGSDLTNIVFGRAGSSILAVTPTSFYDNFFFDLAVARGMIWNELYCGEITVERSGVSSDFLVDEMALDCFVQGYCRADQR